MTDVNACVGLFAVTGAVAATAAVLLVGVMVAVAATAVVLLLSGDDVAVAAFYRSCCILFSWLSVGLLKM